MEICQEMHEEHIYGQFSPLTNAWKILHLTMTKLRFEIFFFNEYEKYTHKICKWPKSNAHNMHTWKVGVKWMESATVFIILQHNSATLSHVCDSRFFCFKSSLICCIEIVLNIIIEFITSVIYIWRLFSNESVTRRKYMSCIFKTYSPYVYCILFPLQNMVLYSWGYY